MTETEPRIIEPATSIAPSTAVSGAWLASCLDRSVERINALPDKAQEKELLRLQYPCINRPMVIVTKRIPGSRPLYISDITSLRRLLTNATEVIQEKAYCGRDAAKVAMFRVTLPESYEARIPCVRLMDVPKSALRNNSVVVKRNSPYLALCEEVDPIWTHLGSGSTTAEDMEFYRCITVKVRLKSYDEQHGMYVEEWHPGVSIWHKPHQEKDEQFVLLGKPYPPADPRTREKASQTTSTEQCETTKN